MAEQAHRSDPYELLQIRLNPEGSVARIQYPTIPSSPTYDLNNPTPVLSKDVTFDPSNDAAWFRIYLPFHCLQKLDDGVKLPVVFYLHGGAFMILSPDVTIFHSFCSDMAAFVPAIVVSLEYPLAPEHRLPAAYDHLVRALRWINTTGRTHIDWLRDHADFSNCFLMGNSAGGNLAYHVGLRLAADQAQDLESVKMRGLVLHHPGFGAIRRTPTELRLVDDPVLPLAACDLVWELSLPIGADRDHEYCNPTAGGGSKDVDKMRALGWRVLVTGFQEDPMYDHQTGVAKWLESKGVTVETMFKPGGGHAFELNQGGSHAMPLHIVLKKFINNN